MSGFVSSDIDHFFNQISHAAFLLYEQSAVGVLPFVSETRIAAALNKAKDSLLAGAVCPVHDQAPPLRALDFRHLVFGGVSFTEKLLALKDHFTAQDVNEKIASLIGGSGTYVHPGFLVGPVNLSITDFAWQQADWIKMNPGLDVDAGPNASWPKFLNASYRRLFDGPAVCLECSRIGQVEFEVGNVVVSGLDSLTEFAVFTPSGPSSMRNNIAAAGIQVSAEVGLRVQGNKSYPHPLHIDDSFSLQLGFEDIDLLVDVLLNVSENRFNDLRLRDFLPEDITGNHGTFHTGGLSMEAVIDKLVHILEEILQKVGVNVLQLLEQRLFAVLAQQGRA